MIDIYKVILNFINLRTLVGIDFSLNSPAFCIYKNGRYYLGTLTRSERSEESLKKNKKKPFAVLCEMDMVEMIFMDKEKMPESYVEKERVKIDSFDNIVRLFWNKILDIVGDDDFSVAIEGLSFSSNGNALIDISMATGLLRRDIIKKIGRENFYVFSPAAIKKFAIKGNAKKHELYAVLMNREHNGTNLDSFTNILNDNYLEWVTKSYAVNKPLDDIIDSIWVCLFLENQII